MFFEDKVFPLDLFLRKRCWIASLNCGRICTEIEIMTWCKVLEWYHIIVTLVLPAISVSIIVFFIKEKLYMILLPSGSRVPYHKTKTSGQTMNSKGDGDSVTEYDFPAGQIPNMALQFKQSW
mmetsp:Transcript_4602/g.10391  ORF Transcript_4602/g.10391 Transcript_4602/m.10391 type:complete len:122 (+) Transcript_4602:617-982(+)